MANLWNFWRFQIFRRENKPSPSNGGFISGMSKDVTPGGGEVDPSDDKNTSISKKHVQAAAMWTF